MNTSSKKELIYKDGKPKSVILPIREYERLLASAEHLDDLKDFKRLKNEPSQPFDEFLKRNGLPH